MVCHPEQAKDLLCCLSSRAQRGLLCGSSSRAQRATCWVACHPERSEEPAVVCHPARSEGMLSGKWTYSHPIAFTLFDGSAPVMRALVLKGGGVL